MKTSLTTSEHRIREWILDLLHGQWLALGVPFAVRRARPDEMIDPEALLWCSLEFFPTQPRLREQVLVWWARNADSLLLPRLRKFALEKASPRTAIWQSLGPPAFPWKSLNPQQETCPTPSSEPCYGQSSVEELQTYCHNLSKHIVKWPWRRQTVEPESPFVEQVDEPKKNTVIRQQRRKVRSTCAATILRARDVFGTDARHFLLVYLLVNRSGARLRSVAQWSGQTYQNVAKTAKRWEAANLITLDHGFARLKNPETWEAVLGLEQTPSQPIVLVNWPRFFDACVTLLRYLARANEKSLPADGPVVTGLIRQAIEDAAASVESATPSQTVRDFAAMLVAPPENASHVV